MNRLTSDEIDFILNEIIHSFQYAECGKRRITAAEILLKYNKNVNAVDTKGKTLLHYAVSRYLNISVVRDLLEAGININASSSTGYVAIHHYIPYSNVPDVLELLATSGADVNARTQWLRTPLHLALCIPPNSGVLVTVEVLLRHGADINAVDDLGNTPVSLAIELRHSYRVMELLMDYEPDITATLLGSSFQTFLGETLQHGLGSNVMNTQTIIKYVILNNPESNWKDMIRIERYDTCKVYPRFTKLIDDCISEISLIKNKSVNGNSSLYDWYRLTKKCRLSIPKPLYSTDSNLKDHINNSYPVYNDIILPKLKPGLERGEMIQQLLALVFPDFRCKRVFQNTYCLLKIIEYLPNSDVLNFISAFNIYGDDSEESTVEQGEPKKLKLLI